MICTNCLTSKVTPDLISQFNEGYVQTAEGRLFVRERTGRGVAVIFESGAGTWSDHWKPTLQCLPATIRGIAYDRPGLGLSPTSSAPRTAKQMAREITALLDALNIEECILVGHSFGATVLRQFSYQHPERVHGLLFVDGFHESFSQWQDKEASQAHPLLERLFFIFAGMGLLALIGRLSRQPRPAWCEHDEEWRRIEKLSQSGRFFRTMRREINAYLENDLQLRAQPNPTAPIIALVCEYTLNADEAPDHYPWQEHNTQWRIASAKLGQLNESGDCEFIDNRDHMSILANPESTIAAIERLVERVSR